MGRFALGHFGLWAVFDIHVGRFGIDPAEVVVPEKLQANNS